MNTQGHILALKVWASLRAWMLRHPTATMRIIVLSMAAYTISTAWRWAWVDNDPTDGVVLCCVAVVLIMISDTRIEL